MNRHGLLEVPIVVKNLGPLLLDDFVSDDAAWVRLSEFEDFGSLVAENFVGGEAGFDRVFVFELNFVTVGGDGPGFEGGDLGLIVKADDGESVVIASLGTKKLVGTAGHGFRVAVIFDGGLTVVEQNDRNGVFRVVGELFAGGSAQPVRSRTGSASRYYEPGERAYQRRGNQQRNASCLSQTPNFEARIEFHRLPLPC
jgi:hypothetical protein